MVVEPIKELRNNDWIQQVKVANYRGYDLIVSRIWDDLQKRWVMRLDASTKDKRLPCVVGMSNSEEWPSDKQIDDSNIDDFRKTKVWLAAYECYTQMADKKIKDFSEYKID